ncbi:MAG: amidohydrolase family protein [Methanomassiliicoccales archaeon]
MLSPSIELRNISLLLTMDKTGSFMRHVSIFIEDGRIVSIAANGSAVREKAEVVIDCNGLIALPGLVDAHSHINYGMAISGIVSASRERGSYIRSIVECLSLLRSDEQYAISLLTLCKQISNGCTSIHEPGLLSYSTSVERAVKAAGVRALLGIPFVEFENEYGLPPMEHDKIISLVSSHLKHFRDNTGLIEKCISPFSHLLVSMETSAVLRDIAVEHNASISFHSFPTQGERRRTLELCRKEGRNSIYELLESAGLSGSHILLSHPVWLTSTEVKHLAADGCRGVLCPNPSSLNRGLARAPLISMVMNGMKVGLGTDSYLVSPDMDLFAVSSTASNVFASGKWPLDSSFFLLNSITSMGADALFPNHGYCSILEGSPADIVLIRCDSHSLSAQGSIYDSILKGCAGSDVEYTIAGGRVLYERGTFVCVDIEKLRLQVKDVILRLKSTLSDTHS